jgi:hypothetical protein
LGLPLIDYNSTGELTYTAEDQRLNISASPLFFSYLDETSDPPTWMDAQITPKPNGLELSIQVSPVGQLLGGVPGDDLRVTGDIDFDWDGQIDYSGVLLTGEILAFGFEDTGPTAPADSFDFRFVLTGGALASYWGNREIGLLTTSEDSTFTGEFERGFAGEAKGSIGSLEVAYQPGIDLEKYVNGEDADAPTGPEVLAGGQVLWTYQVTNTGNVPLANVAVSDSDSTVTPAYVSGDANNDGLLDVDETWLYEATGIAVAGQYANTGTVTARDARDTLVTDTDPSHYFGVRSGIDLEKYVNGDDADAPTGPEVLAGSEVTWTYQVTNTGNVPLANVAVSDSDSTVTPAYVSGDANNDGLLDVDETWLYQATGVAVAGQYANTGTVTANDTLSQQVTDTDLGHYVGRTAAVNIEKYVKTTCGGEGLTPGFWKQKQHFCYWTWYRPTDRYNDVFHVSDPENPTLLDVLERGGGGYKALGRQAVAALLNAVDSDVDYLYIPSEITAFVQQAYATRDYEGYKDLLATENELGAKCCPTCDEPPSYGDDADKPTGPVVYRGQRLLFTYVVTNPGDMPLADVTITDSQAGIVPLYMRGDADRDGLLDVGETWLYTATVTITCSIPAGQQMNLGTVVGTPLGSDSLPLGSPVTDKDPAYWHVGSVHTGCWGWFPWQDWHHGSCRPGCSPVGHFGDFCHSHDMDWLGDWTHGKDHKGTTGKPADNGCFWSSGFPAWTTAADHLFSSWGRSTKWGIG